MPSPLSGPQRPRTVAETGRLRSNTIWTRMKRGRLGFADVATVVAGAVILCSASLLALDATLVHRPPAAQTPRAERPSAPRDLSRYTGQWISDKGARLIVSRKGAVWADSGALLGAARIDDDDATRLVFEGTGFRCLYRVSAERDDSLDWQVVEGSPRTRCPAGRFNRHFTF